MVKEKRPYKIRDSRVLSPDKIIDAIISKANNKLVGDTDLFSIDLFDLPIVRFQLQSFIDHPNFGLRTLINVIIGDKHTVTLSIETYKDIGNIKILYKISSPSIMGWRSPFRSMPVDYADALNGFPSICNMGELIFTHIEGSMYEAIDLIHLTFLECLLVRKQSFKMINHFRSPADCFNSFCLDYAGLRKIIKSTVISVNKYYGEIRKRSW